MKTYKILLFFLFSILFISCSDDDDIIIQDQLRLSLTSCTLNEEIPYIDVEILEGKGDYLINSSDESIAEIKYEDNIVSIFGLNVGEAIITVSDFENNTATIKVSVTETISRPISVSQDVKIKLGQRKPFGDNYDTNKSFSVNIKDDSIISIHEIDDKRNIRADKVGQTSVSLTKNRWIYHTYNITVVEQYDLDISQSRINITWDGNTPGLGLGVVIQSGNGQYSVISFDDEIVSAEIKDYHGDYNITFNQPAIAWIYPKKVGSGIITVKDEISGQTADIEISISER